MLGMFTRLMKLMPLLAAGGAVTGAGGDLGQVQERFLGVIKEVKTQTEMRAIVKVMRLDIISGEAMPRDVTKYARANMDSQGTDPGHDSWGMPYSLERTSEGTFLVSCGPDTDCGSDDDVAVMVVTSKNRFGR